MLVQLSVLANLVTSWLGRRRDERGASLVEYALLLALVVVVAIGALVLVGGGTTNLINNSGKAFANR